MFISSTSRGLAAVREAVAVAVLGINGFAPVAMESFGLRATAPLEVCFAKVRESAVYLGIVGLEYPN